MRNNKYKSADKTNDKSAPNKKIKGVKNKKYTAGKRVIPVEERDNISERNNDPAWYFTSAELAEQSSQLSFQNVLGFGSLEHYEVPTILRLDVNPSCGVTYNFDQAGSDFVSTQSSGQVVPTWTPGKAGVNLMAAKLYTLLSSFTGRTSSYAPQDVAMMILAISSIAEMAEHIRRIFGLAMTYNYRNRTLPLGLIRSMGIDTDDLSANLSIYRTAFNVAMARINQIPLLENIAYIKKARDIFQRIYMDDPTNMSQIFYYAPAGYYVLDEVGDSDGSILRYNYLSMPNASQGLYGSSISALIGYLNDQITAVLESSTLNFIYADLLNMANKMNVQTWKFDYLAENYVVMPEYNANALLQLHNSTIIGVPADILDSNSKETRHTVDDAIYGTDKPYVTGGNDVFCDANANNVLYSPVFKTSVVAKHCIVDMPMDNPTVVDRIEALRWLTCSSGGIATGANLGIGGSAKYEVGVALPDHYICRALCFGNIKGGDGNTPVPFKELSATVMGAGNLLSVLYLTQFEHAPIIRGVNPGVGVTDIVGQLQFYTDVDYVYIKRLVDITYIGLFEFRV